jgi:AcrR family transcriptional regulator
VETSRTYRGVTPAQRRAERRERLLAAGLELFGTVGYAHTSVRAVSAAASLNSRYFYESFGSREDLLYSVYQRILTDIFTRASEAVVQEDTIEGKARAGLRAGWTAVTEDRRKARIVALEVVGVSERMERLRRESRRALAQLTAEQALSLAGGVTLRLDPVLTARALMGGVVEVLLAWINGDVDASVDEVVEHFTVLFTAAAFAAVGEQAPGPGAEDKRLPPSRPACPPAGPRAPQPARVPPSRPACRDNAEDRCYVSF